MENKFERVLWNTRFIVILVVILSIISSITLFLLGAWDIIDAIVKKNLFLTQQFQQTIAYYLK